MGAILEFSRCKSGFARLLFDDEVDGIEVRLPLTSTFNFNELAVLEFADSATDFLLPGPGTPCRTHGRTRVHSCRGSALSSRARSSPPSAPATCSRRGATSPPGSGSCQSRSQRAIARSWARSPSAGNRYLRVLFVQAAWVVLVKPMSWERHGLKSWIEAAKKRLHHNVLAIALANKLARIAWAVLAKGRGFEAARTVNGSTQPA